MKKNKSSTRLMYALLPCMLFLAAGLASCNSDDMSIDGCYSAQVIGAFTANDTLRAIIREAPEGILDNQPAEGHYLKLLKSDLHNPDIQTGDTIDFKIKKYEEISIFEILLSVNWNMIYKAYFCRVKPCK